MILANTPSVELLLVIGCVVAYLLPAVASARLSVQNSQRALGVRWLLHGVLLLGALVGALPRFWFCARAFCHGLAGIDRVCHRAPASRN